MVSRDFQTLAGKRAARARLLAGRYPPSREVLLFQSEIALLQQRLDAPPHGEPSSSRSDSLDLDSLLSGRAPLIELVEARGPQRLRDEARRYDQTAGGESLRAYLAREDTTSPRSFFARVLLQPAMFRWEPAENTPNDPASVSSTAWAPSMPAPPAANAKEKTCPRCGHAPQAGSLRPQGDGTALTLVCSLCLREWPFPRLQCPACGETDHHQIHFYSTAELDHIEVQVCDSCNSYLHLVSIAKQPSAIADIDELAALPLDVWAHEKGYRKIHPNLAGI